jgi:hypothetical protein
MLSREGMPQLMQRAVAPERKLFGARPDSKVAPANEGVTLASLMARDIRPKRAPLPVGQTTYSAPRACSQARFHYRPRTYRQSPGGHKAVVI